MSSDNDHDELAARKARNEAIRRARERHNAGVEPDDGSTPGADADKDAPNYAEFIDRKMREGNKPKG